MGISRAVVENLQWMRGQKPSLLVVLGNGPAYNPGLDVRFSKHVQFFSNPDVKIASKNWQLAPFGSIAGTPSDVFRITQAKVFSEYDSFAAQMPRSPRVVTDFSQGNADIFHSQDVYGWPPPPVPEYWSPQMVGGAPVINSFPAYPFARDVFLLRQKDKTFQEYQFYFTGLKGLGAINYLYTPGLDTTRFTRQDKTFRDYDSFISISNRGTRLVTDAFPTYNPATDVTRFARQGKAFDDYQVYWRGQPITINAITFFATYNPATDVVAKPRPPVFYIPYDDSQWNTGQKPAYNIVLNVSPAPPPVGTGNIVVQPFGGRVIFNPKLAGTNEIVPFDFISKLATGETILTVNTASSVYSGVDTTVSLQPTGVASVNGSLVNQQVTGGLVGVIYELKCTVTTSLGQTLVLVGYLNVEPDLT